MNQRGFTIIECMIAMAFIAITFAAVAKLQYSTVRNNTTGNMTTEASMLAREKIESIQEKLYLLTDDGTFTEQSGPYHVWWKIDTHGVRSKKINVHVSWDRFGKKRYVKIRALAAGWPMRDPGYADETDWEEWKKQFNLD